MRSHERPAYPVCVQTGTGHLPTQAGQHTQCVHTGTGEGMLRPPSNPRKVLWSGRANRAAMGPPSGTYRPQGIRFMDRFQDEGACGHWLDVPRTEREEAAR